ncbi:MAG: hypothetical protein ABH883_00645 [Candidatus Omnitrophota bacterium]
MRGKILFFLLLFSAMKCLPLSADEGPDAMIKLFISGYTACARNDFKSAAKDFTEAASLAEKNSSWKGLVDAGDAFSVLGNPEKALETFKSARRAASKNKDWRGLVAVSYAFSALPENLSPAKDAETALTEAREYAAKNSDWRGLIETARGFHKLEKKDKASLVLSSAEKIIGTSGLSYAAAALAIAAKENGDSALYEKARKMSSSFGEDEKKYSSTLPGEITPYEKEEKEAWKKQLDRIRGAEKQNLESFMKYKRYYNRPYYIISYGPWHRLTVSEINNWALYHLSEYK